MIVVVGSGASGVHFALSLLQKGHRVTMIDVGNTGPDPVSPGATLNDLKAELDDPAAYFLGERYEGLLLPDDRTEYYGIPPNKQYVFEKPEGFGYQATGFAPLFSFAQGGLAQAWTGGCYPLNDQELRHFPFGYTELAPHYDEIARRIGISGAEDDLARFMPVHDHLLPPLELDAHSATLLAAYERRRDALIDKLGCYMGRTRVATLSRPLGSRKPCEYLGRCLWGCPIEALYTPAVTLRECLSYPEFTYRPGTAALYFRLGGTNRIDKLVVRQAGGGIEDEVAVETLVLAAGALFSTKIIAHSILRETGEAPCFAGLMDNRQILVPFVNLRMLGEQFAADSYQYHLLGLALEADDPADYVHGQITTLKTALMHPIIQRLPFDLRTSTYLTRSLHGALGLLNANFSDTRRDDNFVTLDADGADPELKIRYAPAADEPARIGAAMKRIKKALHRLGCFVPPGMAHVRPMGASVHYAGTLPMTRAGGAWTTTPECRSRDFDNLYVVDGTTFPSLPAKNLTFTLMANAVRVAESAF